MDTLQKLSSRLFLTLVLALASLTPGVIYAAHEECPGGSTKENYCAKYVCNRCDASGQCHDGYSQVGCAGASLGGQCGQIDDIYKCGDGSIRGHAVAINCSGDCAYNGDPNPTPTTAPKQCASAPLILIDKNDGTGFHWFGAKVNINAGTKVCYKTSPVSYFQTARQTQAGTGYKGVSYTNTTTPICFIMNPANSWMTGGIEAFTNLCNSVAEATAPNSQCAQNYSNEGCRSFTDIVPVAATATPGGPTPTPKPPTPTPIPLLQCSRVAVLKNGVEVPAPYTLVKYMDRVTFRGFANATGRTATSMTFSHSIIPPGSTTGRATTTTVPMTLVGNIWQADYTYLMIDAGTHRVEAVSIQ